MTTLEQTIRQRCEARMGIAHLRCMLEHETDTEDYKKLKAKVDELETWLFDESPIA